MYGYLLRNRVIFIGSRITDEVTIYCLLACPTSLLGIRSHAHCPTSVNTIAVALLQLATQIVASLLALETLNDSEDIKLYINSPGILTLT